MKKLIAGLLGLVLSVTVALPSMAQNKVGKYDSLNVGSVSYSLNSGGAFYGQLFNSASASNWSLGFGSSQSTSGTAVLTWDKSGHIGLGGIAAPIVSSCGTSPSVALGSDSAGDVTVGTGAANTCTLTFAAAYTAIPSCVCSDRTTSISCLAKATTSTVVLTPTGSSSFGALDALSYICFGS